MASLVPRLMIASIQGRSGKTTITTGLCAALRKRGFSVQPFKKGPDYIDPSWLAAAAGRSCRNLDIFLMGEEGVQASFRRACKGADIAVIEGAMGLYDGPYPDGRGSSADLARLLQVPVILLVNASRMTRSVAAMVTGCQTFEPDIAIAGVILNHVAGRRHEHKLVTAVEGYCNIPVLEVVPRDVSLQISERHLGLVPFKEGTDAVGHIERIRRQLEECLDLDRILNVAEGAEKCVLAERDSIDGQGESKVRIGVVFDKAFNFYYPENLEVLCYAGAELVVIDSLRGRSMPKVDALYIGGGFPEFFLKELEGNGELRQEIAEAVERGMPVYAECAGLMYLCRTISWQDRSHEMVGAIPADVELCERPQGHGYVEAEVVEENPLLPLGMIVRGHEFHHSRLSTFDTLKSVYRLRRGRGIDGERDGVLYKNVFASYMHVHALGTPGWAEGLVSMASRDKGCREIAA